MATAKQTKEPVQDAAAAHDEVVNVVVEETASVTPGRFFTIPGRDPFDESSEADEEVVLETNVHGLIRMTRLVLPHLRDGGHIVNMGSVAGKAAYPNGSLYVTSKFAVHGFTQALREDLLGRPIRITNVAPGLVETDFSKVRFRGDEAKASAVYAGVALGGPIRPLKLRAVLEITVSSGPKLSP